MRPSANSRMRRNELVGVYRELLSRGYRVPYSDSGVPPERLLRADLLYAIESAEAPSSVFGHHRVVIRKSVESLSWSIHSSEEAPPLLFMKWRHAFEWRELSSLTTAPDQFAALSACLMVEPLTKSDLAALEAAFPGVTGRPMYEVDADDSGWEVEEEEEEEPEPLLEEEEAGPSPFEESQPSLGRKITF